MIGKSFLSDRQRLEKLREFIWIIRDLQNTWVEPEKAYIILMELVEASNEYSFEVTMSIIKKIV